MAERRAPRLKFVLAALAVFAVVVTAGLAHTWVRVERIRLGYRLSELTGQHQALRRERDRLKLEVATLKAPLRIERMARERLGMRPPRPSQVIVLRDVPEPREATAARTGATGDAAAHAAADASGRAGATPARRDAYGTAAGSSAPHGTTAAPAARTRPARRDGLLGLAAPEVR